MTDLQTSIIIFAKHVPLLQLFECWLCPSSGIWEGYLRFPDTLVPITRSVDCLLFCAL